MLIRNILIIIFYCISIKVDAQQNLLLKNKSVIGVALKDWIASFKNFNINDFVFKEEDTRVLEQDSSDFEPEEISKNYANPFMYIYNRSKTYAVDIIGDQADLVYEKGKFVFENADDGGHILLYHIRQKKTYRIGYNSFSAYAEEAIWLNDTTFLLAFVLNDNGARKPTIYIGDIANNEMLCYINKNAKCVSSKKSYTNSILKKLKAPKSFQE